jgi:hypothetical protein
VIDLANVFHPSPYLLLGMVFLIGVFMVAFHVAPQE